jgi:hypothetical protein
MPSDERTAHLLQVLAPARAPFHDAVAAAVDELRSYINAHRPSADLRAEISAGLGQFAAGRLDPDRFAALFGTAGRLSTEELARLESALETLRETLQHGPELYRVEVAQGADLRDCVRSALAARGRVFAAARGAERIRSGRVPEAMDDAGGFAFRHWNRAERQIAPPLVIEVDGSDLVASGLAEYLEGRVKLLLVVRGQAPSAPLARLIAPHVYVQQTLTTDSLESFARCSGPAIAAVMGEGAAVFTHDPAAGGRLAQRLRIESLPAGEPRRALGAVSIAQQQADLDWLRELKGLVSVADVPTAEVVAAAAPAPADLLASWLLRQTDLTGA